MQDGSISTLKANGYGDLFPTATRNTRETYLALPRGFEYNVIGKARGPMTDGRPTPILPDGMSTFKVGRELRIVRNHEITGGKIPRPGTAIGTRDHYDETGGGGTTTLVIDPRTREIIRDFVSLSGTIYNCAGGPTPWGSWISCEETTLGPSVRTDIKGKKSGGFLKPHGYCFEVAASANGTLPPIPLKAMGRFVHEAVAVDGRSGVVYLTEDYATACFYRFLPNRSGRLTEGGVLQALSIKASPGFDTRKGLKSLASFDATWVNIDHPDGEEADLDEIFVYKQGLAKGAATFARLEGCCIDKGGRVYFSSTNGGDAAGGQIWCYDPDGRDGGRLTLLYESVDRELLDMPDNICLRPHSKHVFICEDSDYVGIGGTPDNYVRILTPDGRIADLARNVTAGLEKTEFAGATFSKDGKTFFVNLQTVGATFAIWGDWDRFKA